MSEKYAQLEDMQGSDEIMDIDLHVTSSGVALAENKKTSDVVAFTSILGDVIIKGEEAARSGGITLSFETPEVLVNAIGTILMKFLPMEEHKMLMGLLSTALIKSLEEGEETALEEVLRDRMDDPSTEEEDRELLRNALSNAVAERIMRIVAFKDFE